MTEEEPLGRRLQREAREAHAKDPIRMVIVVRKSLNLSPGKLAAQCTHAGRHIEKLMRSYADYAMQAGMRAKDAATPDDEAAIWKAIHDRLIAKLTIYAEWEWYNDYGVLVKAADDKDFEKVKKLYPHSAENAIEKGYVVIVDKGYTEIAPDTETVLALWPMKASEWPSLIKRLRLVDVPKPQPPEV